ncbi:MAG: ABC transporter permease, partial [Chitinophagaceae bacterium]
MLKMFFKTVTRSLWKNKGYSFLNIFGLAIGIACAGLIFLWVENETSFDNSYAKKDQLYQVKMNNEVEGGVRTHTSTPGVMGPALLAEIPGIANTCRSTEGNRSQLFTIGDKALYAAGAYTDPSVFDMFGLSFTQGNAANAFAQVYSLVITEKTAKKFFGGQENVIGKTIRVNNSEDYMISGVIKDIPVNSTFQFEWIAPFQVQLQKYDGLQRWTNFNTSTFVELKPGVNPSTINQQLYDYIMKKQGGDKSISHAFLFSMNDWHLRDNFIDGKQTGGQIQFVHLFSIIAWIILLIACINFMNLATARSEKRAREVGVRKVLGVTKKRLIAQFIGEAFFMAALAAVLSIIIMLLVLPLFNTLVQQDLSLGLGRPSHIGGLLLLTAICGIVAGSYPSLYLSSFNPVFVLKGIKLKTGSAAMIRKGLVIVQFSVSIILIIGTIIIYKQIQHVK